MGLFDSIAGSVMQKMLGAEQGSTAQIALSLFQQQGGVDGVIKLFNQQGLSHLIESWISTGANLPISSEQVHQVLGAENIQAISQKMDIAPEDILNKLSQHLPRVVDQLSPDGKLPNSTAELMSRAVSLLKS
jgi:uncharacterized protein YidB (DUF937 family)